MNLLLVHNSRRHSWRNGTFRRTGLLLVLLCGMLPSPDGRADEQDAAATAASQPNILFIYTDDHSHRTISCYPEAFDWVETPNIDKLAAAGVRFETSYIGTWCMPSRATMLTGRHGYGIESMRMEGEYPGSTYDPQQCRFWPSEFRQRGYKTAHIGKWHTGTDTGAGRDWDHQIVWNRPRYPKNAGNYYGKQLIETNGGKAVMTQGYSTDNYTQWAQEYLTQPERKQQPWYLWLCYSAVHGPFTPADRHLQKYADIKVPTPADIFPPRAGKPDWQQKIDFWLPGPNGHPVLKGKNLEQRSVKSQPGIHGDRLTDWVRQYHQAVMAIDDGVGQLLKTLEETGQLQNTVIVFTSDQGFAWGQHGFRHKLAPYDATIRSPLIVVAPGITSPGSVCPHPVAGVDLPPTFFSLAGLELPWAMHGHDLLPLLKNPTDKSWKHPVLAVHTGDRYGSATTQIPETLAEQELAGVPWWVSLRAGRFKYIRTLLAGEGEELYDVESDPEELRNLASERTSQGKLEAMRTALAQELKRTKAGFVDNMPDTAPPR